MVHLFCGQSYYAIRKICVNDYWNKRYVVQRLSRTLHCPLNWQQYCLPVLPSGRRTYIKRCINVFVKPWWRYIDVYGTYSSWRRTDVNTTLHKRQELTSTLMRWWIKVMTLHRRWVTSVLRDKFHSNPRSSIRQHSSNTYLSNACQSKQEKYQTNRRRDHQLSL